MTDMRTPKFPYSQRSLAALQTCHPELQRLFLRVADHVDVTIVEGHREEAQQMLYYETGRSKLKFPESKHNKRPSLAVDAVAYPVQAENTLRQIMFSGLVIGVALEMGIAIRVGADWDMNLDPTDNWIDAWHFELITKGDEA